MNKRAVIIFVILVMWVFYSGPLKALDPERAVTQYMIDTWDDESGLPQNSVLAILQTSDGYLWLGTEEGLNRFDGVTFTTFDENNTPEITDNYIISLLEDSQQNLWIGIRRGGLVQYKNGKFKRYTKKEGLLHDIVNCIVEGPEKDIWLGTHGGGLYRLKDNKFRSYKKKDGLPGDVIKALHKDSKGNLWIGCGNGLARFRDNRFSRYRIREEGDQGCYIRTIYEDSSGTLWIGTTEGLFRMQDDKIIPSRLNARYPDIVIFTVCEDRDKNLWIGTARKGIFRYRDGEFSHLSKEHGLADNTIMSMAEDREGSLWIGTIFGGLNRLRDSKFISFGTLEGLSDDIVFAIYEDSGGYLWIGTNSGLNRMKDGKILQFTTRNGLSHNTVNAFYEDHRGFLWVGTDAGLNQLKNFRSRISKVNSYGKSYVLSVLEDTKGTCWMGTNTSLFGKKKHSKKFELLDENIHVSCIHEDKEKNLWACLYQVGLARYGGGKMKIYDEKNGLISTSLNCLYEDSGSVLWLGSIKGLSRFKDGKFVNFTKKDGLFNNNIYKILEDNSGNFWLSCNKGIFKVSKKDLNDYAEGNIDSIFCVVYGKEDGMRSSECNGGPQNAGCKTRDGKLYFPTMKGIAMIEPEKIKPNPIPPPVLVEQVVLDGVPVPQGAPQGGKIVIRPGVKRVEFHYTALSFLVPKRVKFKHRLLGFNEEWVDAGTLRVASYTNLDPGDYRFQVVACNDDDVWNLQGASITLSAIPPFWRTWWFTLMAVIVFAVLSYSIINFFKKYVSLSSFWKKQKYVGKFKLLDKLGAGGMGTVYKAESLVEKGETVAIKVLREELFEDERNRKRFKQEAAIIDQLDHPNIVRVYERGQSRSSMFIAMELLEGKTLSEKINKEGKIDIFECLHIMAQVTDAIAKIHSKGIIHRDMKPDNVMLVERDNDPNFVKLLDFGLAKMQHQTRLTQTGMVMGTINYMAPEQIAGSGFSGATDIYSMGVVFYEMLTAEKPFVGETTIDIMKQIIDNTPIEPVKYRFDTPMELNDLVLAMMEKKQKDRPNAEEVLKALKRIYTRLND